MPHLHQISCFLVFVLFHVVTVTLISVVTATNQDVDPGDPLYLTPLIESGEISKAMEAAFAEEFLPIVSYSGLITVNSSLNSNIYFWFFPAEGKEMADNNAPVVLWNDGGPGIAGFFSIFGQNGPFTGSDTGDNYTLSPNSWHRKYNMIYMDNPVDVGFSFTESGYITSAEEAARDIYEFLIQFFSMFPHLQRNPFYNAGVSYGASYAIQTANYIHHRNWETPKLFINLTGVLVDSPWIDSYSQVDYGDYLFNVGLISEDSRDHFREQQNEIRNLIDQERYLEAFSVWKQISQLDAYTLTGYGAINNVYNDQLPLLDMTNFIIQNSTRKALHVGALKFQWVSPTQQERMHANMLRSAKPQMEALLQAGYRFLLYVGNMDGTTGHIGIQKLIKSLSWDGASDLINAERSIWRENGRVAGYNMTSSNATFLIVRNAGHGCLLDQPAWVLNAVVSFIGEVNDNNNANSI